MKPSGSGRSGEADSTGRFMVRIARSDCTRCLRSRHTRSGSIDTKARVFSGTVTVWSPSAVLMQGSVPYRRVAFCPTTGKDTAVAIPIILDCDPGTDDAFALMLAVASAEIDVLAITVAGGNVGLEQTLPNALALVSLAGAPVPVYRGADRPLLGAFVSETRVHGIDGLGGIALPAGGAAAPGIAADVIRDILRDAARPVTLVGIAPVTNLALALMTEPALTAKVERIVLMTGAWGEGNATPAAEFNALSDPEALAVLLACGRPVVLATLELTAQALCTPARLATLRAGGTGACRRALCDIQATVPLGPRLGGAGAPLHDPCAIAWLVRPDLFTTRDCAVTVDLGPGPSRGRTVIDRWGRTGAPHNATVLETLDADGFFTLLGERVAHLP
jgi:inosine-uridine nucleoside N-ribohydrolase